MAALDAAGLQLARSLPVEAVPAKLRCGSCNKLAINAVKLPCCDQSICESCSEDLPESCPICAHSPLSSEDCKPNKSLRMTVKAFVKSEEKKRSKEMETPAPQLSEIAASILPASATPVAESALVDDAAADGKPFGEGQSTTGVFTVGQGETSLGEAVPSVETPQESEDPNPALQIDTGADAGPVADEDDDEEDEDDDVVITTERPEEEDKPTQGGQSNFSQNQGGQEMGHMQTNGDQNFGFNSNQHGNGNMEFNPMNFNPMMAMQNGMGMGNFPMGMPNMLGMPGMPGMNMDPSMMFGGGGFGGMNMNDMNMMSMAMGMGGMGGFGGGMGGMGGMNGPNPGFFPGQGGYNHPNFGSQMNQSFPPNRGYGRPYGRGGYGRGGRGAYGYNRGGRGGWQNYANQQQGQNQYMNQQMPQHQQHQNGAGQIENMEGGSQTENGGRRGSPSYEPMKSGDGSINDSNVISRQEGGNTNAGDGAAADQADGPTADQNQNADGDAEITDAAGSGQVQPQTEALSGGDNDVSGDQFNAENSYRYQQSGQNGFRGQNGTSAYGYVATVASADAAPSQMPAPPINAPTGPKAMREGLPNSGIYSRSQPSAVASIPSQSYVDSAERNGDENGGHDGERRRSESRSRSRSRHRSRKHRDRSADEYESDRTYERRKERERRRRHKERKHDEEGVNANGHYDNREGHSKSDEVDERRSKRHGRDRDDEHHSSRSHRDRSREKRRRRDRSRSHTRNGDGDGDDGSKEKHRSSRHHESRDHSKNRERAKRHKDSSRDEEGRRRSDKHHSRDSSHRPRSRERSHKSMIEQPEDDIGFKIKGGSRKANGETSMPPPAPGSRRRDHESERRFSNHDGSGALASFAPLDSYAAERQAREQARMERHRSQLAESNRSTSLGKRSSREDDEVDAPKGPKGYADGGRKGKKARSMSHQYEDESHDTKRWR